MILDVDVGVDRAEETLTQTACEQCPRGNLDVSVAPHTAQLLFSLQVRGQIGCPRVRAGVMSGEELSLGSQKLCIGEQAPEQRDLFAIGAEHGPSRLEQVRLDCRRTCPRRQIDEHADHAT